MVNDDPRGRLDTVAREIDDARSRLSRLRHEGERHFIDDAQVDPEVARLLADVVAAGERVEHLTVNRAGIQQLSDDDHQRLADIEQQISRLRELSGPKDERHFIDG